MRVLFVTSEVAGFFKRGGLADVSRDLPVALSTLGIDVSVILPFYAEIAVGEVKCVGQLSVDFKGNRELVFIFKSKIPGTNVDVYLPRHPLFDKYHDPKIEERFIFFSEVAAQFFLYSSNIVNGVFDIVHCHAGMQLLYLDG